MGGYEFKWEESTLTSFGGTREYSVGIGKLAESCCSGLRPVTPPDPGHGNSHLVTPQRAAFTSRLLAGCGSPPLGVFTRSPPRSSCARRLHARVLISARASAAAAIGCGGAWEAAKVHVYGTQKWAKHWMF